MKQAKTISGEILPMNETETEVFHFGQWKEIQQDQEGDLYIMGGLNPVYILPTVAPKEDKDNSGAEFTGGEWFVNWSGHPDNGRIQIGSGKDFVCEMYPLPDDEANEQENVLQTKANARLIAAAPAMYAALKELLSTTQYYLMADFSNMGLEHPCKLAQLNAKAILSSIKQN